jgi:hypothetical protein
MLSSCSRKGDCDRQQQNRDVIALQHDSEAFQNLLRIHGRACTGIIVVQQIEIRQQIVVAVETR